MFIQQITLKLDFLLIQASFKMREVVVTGMGLISCIGNDLDTVSKNLKAGKSGIKLNQEYVDMGFRSHVCGSIDIDLKPLIDRKVLRFMGNASAYAYLAAKDALTDAGLNEDDRKFQHKTVMKLFNMTEELAYMVYVIDELILNENTNELTRSELNELKKSLVITTGDNYVGAAKKQLREKMSDLYSKVASSYDKPSANELENLALIENEMKSANKRYSKILKKVNSTLIPEKPFEDFINE